MCETCMSPPCLPRCSCQCPPQLHSCWGLCLPQEPYVDGAVGAQKLCLHVWFWLRKGVCWRVPKRGAESKPQTDDAEQRRTMRHCFGSSNLALFGYPKVGPKLGTFLHFARALSRKPGACFQTRVPRRAACPACAGATSVCAAKFSAPRVCARALPASAKAEAARRGAGPQVSHFPAMRRARQRMLCSMRGKVLQSAECSRAPRTGRRRIRDAGVQRQGPRQAWL